MSKKKVNLFWFRRDLRTEDNVGFSKALQGKYPVVPVFIFDPEILDGLPKNDARVTFIYTTLQQLRKKLQDTCGSSIATYFGKPLEVFQQLLENFNVQHVITNRDYEPYALRRDEKIKNFLQRNSVGFHSFKDQVIFEKEEVVKEDGSPYLVYTPYMKKWKERFRKEYLQSYTTDSLLKNCLPNSRLPNLTLPDLGFTPSEIEVPHFDISSGLIRDYEENRNFPAKEATSYLSTHLRFGTIGIRTVVQKAITEKNETFWNELIWREFFIQILYHFPETTTKAFKKKYDRIPWRTNKKEFECWKTGQTGYPLVDAGMRQLNTTGWMHNRVRMVVASFLCKHLLIDWRLGETYFAEKLLDYEMASNVGNWQWVAGCGVDAAPYFRIFNPISQAEKFDPNASYIQKWIPELNTSDYPKPIIDHKKARKRTLETYKSALD